MLIGIDLGGTKIEGAVIDDRGNIVQRIRLATPKTDYRATLNCIASLVDQLENTLPGVERQKIIGIATPGSVSSVTKKMKNCNSTCLNHQPLQQDLEQVLERQVRIANDADCFTLSEAMDGAAREMPIVFGVILGTGVGGGVCVHRRLLNGPNSIAGEWGHNPVPTLENRVIEQLEANGRSCYCGKQDCIETYLSGPGFEQSYFLLAGEQIPAIRIVERSLEGDAKAVKVVDTYQDILARSLSIIINILDPHAIVLGGGMSNIESLYTQVPARWSRYIFSDSVTTRLLPAKYGDSSGVRGAAWLAKGDIYDE